MFHIYMYVIITMTRACCRDRIRSTSSVVSHTFCAAVVYSLCQKDLQEVDEKSGMPRNQTDVTIIIDKDGSQEDIRLNGKSNGAGYNNVTAQMAGSSTSTDSSMSASSESNVWAVLFYVTLTLNAMLHFLHSDIWREANATWNPISN